MIQYRPFRNSDPPLLAEIWRAQASQRGIMQPMSAALLEELVLSKPIFDRDGLIVAVGDGQPLGFVHAGFGPTPDQSRLSTDEGVTSMLMTRNSEVKQEVAGELLRRSEEYLRRRGAKVLYGGGAGLLDPFYLGLYGGSELGGVLDSDSQLQSLLLANQYRVSRRSVVFHRDLASFKAPLDRQQIQVRRHTSVHTIVDPPSQSWWEACTFGEFDRTRFELESRQGRRIAQATFWNMEPLATTWGVHAAGMTDVAVTPEERRHGLVTYLLGEAFRQLLAQGVSLVEAQCPSDNEPAIALFRKLGFDLVDRATLYRKD